MSKSTNNLRITLREVVDELYYEKKIPYKFQESEMQKLRKRLRKDATMSLHHSSGDPWEWPENSKSNIKSKLLELIKLFLK